MDVVVIGGGAAGLNGALMLGRARREVLVIDAGEPRNAPAAHMHGFLTRDGMAPAELLEIGRREVARYGVEVVDGRVTKVSPDDDGFVVEFDGRTAFAKRLLITTGLVDELPDVPGLRERWGRDVLHCPYCHGWEVRDQPIGVLAEVHLALLFRQWSPDIVFFEHTSELADEEHKRLSARGVQVVRGEVTGLEVTDDQLSGVRLASGEVVARRALAVRSRHVARSELLGQLGIEPTSHPFGSYIEADPSGKTAVTGVWVAGNVADISATVLSAAASGARAGAAINFDLVQAESA